MIKYQSDQLESFTPLERAATSLGRPSLTRRMLHLRGPVFECDGGRDQFQPARACERVIEIISPVGFENFFRGGGRARRGWYCYLRGRRSIADMRDSGSQIPETA